ALVARPAGFLGRLLAAEADEIVIGDGLGADEALFEIGMDDAGRLRRARSLLDRPGAHLLRPGGEEGDEAEKRVAGADEAVEAGLGEAERFQELLLLGIGELGDLGLNGGRDGDGAGAFGLR